MAEAASIVGIHRRTVSRAVRLHATGGEAALTSKPRGRKPALSDEQKARLGDLVRSRRPEDLGLGGRQWTRAAAAALVTRETGVAVTPARAGKYLNDWGVERLRGRPPLEVSPEA